MYMVEHLDWGDSNIMRQKGVSRYILKESTVLEIYIMTTEGVAMQLLEVGNEFMNSP